MVGHCANRPLRPVCLDHREHVFQRVFIQHYFHGPELYSRHGGLVCGGGHSDHPAHGGSLRQTGQTENFHSPGLSALGPQHRHFRLYQRGEYAAPASRRQRRGCRRRHRGGDGLRHDLFRQHRQRRRLQRLYHRHHHKGEPGPGGERAGHTASHIHAGHLRGLRPPHPAG